MGARKRKRRKRVSLGGYGLQTTRPLTSLVFILPWVVLFEVGMLAVHPERAAQGGPLAYFLLNWLLAVVGVTGYHLPGLAAVLVLLTWHLVRKDPWKVETRTLLAMLGESLVLTIPLLLFNRLVQAATLGPVEGWFSELVLSIGAGIYEELLFRLLLIWLLTVIVVDVFGMEPDAGLVCTVLISAGIFAGMHHQPLGSEPWDLLKFLFRTGAGVYLAGVFVMRGFGVAVGCHAFYDAVVVTWNAISGGGH